MTCCFWPSVTPAYEPAFNVRLQFQNSFSQKTVSDRMLPVSRPAVNDSNQPFAGSQPGSANVRRGPVAASKRGSVNDGSWPKDA